MSLVVERQRQPHLIGFTLAELLVVLVIIGLASAVLAPRLLSSQTGVSAEITAMRLGNLYKESRKQAMLTGISQRVVVDTVAKMAWIDGGINRLTFPVTLELETTTAEAETSPGLAGIRFFPDGVSTGGEVWFVSGNSNVLLSVLWVNGEVRVERVQ